MDEPCTWDDFIAFTADHIQHLLDRTEVIGFCFSYNAEITPDMDGRVKRIDKEVIIKGCEGAAGGRLPEGGAPPPWH